MLEKKVEYLERVVQALADYKKDKVIEVSEIDNEFIKDMVYGVITYKSNIDSLANKYLNKWTIDRLGNTDQAIIRMSIYEMVYTNTPNVVVINEAVELAKKYGDEAAPLFVNGILASVVNEK